MEENKTKVSPTESYLLKRVKDLEKENNKLRADLVVERGHRECTGEQLAELAHVCKELYYEFELQTEESETFDYLRFDGSFFKTLWKDKKRNSFGEQHLIDFLNYVKENL